MDSKQMGAMLTHLKSICTVWAPKEITKEIATTWCNILGDFSDEQVIKAFQDIVKTEEQWPSPAKIRRICLGSRLNDNEIGEDISSRIEGAIRKYGYSMPNEAEKYIGQIGWEVVQQVGGWAIICDLEDDQLLSARKQWRDVGTIISKRLHHDLHNQPPMLPEGAKTNRPSLVGNIVKDLAEKVTPKFKGQNGSISELLSDLKFQG